MSCQVIILHEIQIQRVQCNIFSLLIFSSFKAAQAGQAGHSSHVQSLLLEGGLDPSQARDERVLPMPGKLGIAHQDHVSSRVSESELCPLHQLRLPLVNIVKLCR